MGEFMKKLLLLFLICLPLTIIPRNICLACSYEYDSYDRLVKVIYENGDYIEYTYDSNGNIISVIKHKNDTTNVSQTENDENDSICSDEFDNNINCISNNDYNNTLGDSESIVNSNVNPDSGDNSSENNVIDDGNHNGTISEDTGGIDKEKYGVFPPLSKEGW